LQTGGGMPRIGLLGFSMFLLIKKCRINLKCNKVIANYLILTRASGTTTTDIIHDAETNLKVKATNLLSAVFTSSKGEVGFFVTAGDGRIAFETREYQLHLQYPILHMISWYCTYAGG
jgi:hypothetical protein